MDGPCTADSVWADFCAAQKRLGLADGGFSRQKLTVARSIDSTNSELLRRLQDAGTGVTHGAFHKQTVAALEQTAGRGRSGRSFYSPQDSGIYFSFAYMTPGGGATEPARYTVAAAVGVCRAIQSLYGERPLIKWVNDIYLREKKICGILTEGFVPAGGQQVTAVVTGIGINIVLSESQAQSHGIGGAGGILGPGQGGGGVTRSQLLAECLSRIFGILDAGQDVIAEYRERSLLTGKTVTVQPLAMAGSTARPFCATVTGISDAAELVVRLQDGTTRSLSSGEVTLHGALP